MYWRSMQTRTISWIDYLMILKRRTSDPHHSEDTVIIACQGIGDVLVVETRKKSQERVVATLERLHKSVTARPLKALDSDPSWERISAYVNQLARLLEISGQCQTEEITQYVRFCLCWLLRDLCQQEGNAKRIAFLVRLLNSQIADAFRKKKAITCQALAEWPHTVWRNEQVVSAYWDLLMSELLSMLWLLVQFEDKQLFKHDLGVLLGVNDAESMKRLKQRFVEGTNHDVE
jgi:hypothetical protein